MTKQRLLFLFALIAGTLLVACEAVSGVLTPAPTYTIYPTYTNYPTQTPYPTYTPFPGATAAPPTIVPPGATAAPPTAAAPTATAVPPTAPPPPAPTGTYYADQDLDGFGDPANSVQSGSAPPGYVSNDTDCDDGDADVHPGADEVLDGRDNDCDGQVDEGLTAPSVYFPDVDGDGYGDPTSPVVSESPPPGYVTNGGDCNDADSTVNPGAPERDDDIDHNCSGVADDL